MTNVIEMALSDVVYRDDLYPRIKPDTATIQRYAENLEVLPPIEVNQHGILIDGYHRWTAHRKAEAPCIKAIVTETKSDVELFALAIQRNAIHGLQASDADKKMSAIRLYGGGTGYSKDDIASLLSVSRRTISSYLSDVDKELREQRKQQIFSLWMACETQDDIAAAIDADKATVSRMTEECCNLESLPKSNKLLATFADADFTPPMFNVWRFSKVSNNVAHFGKSEQTIVENLLYLYTEPFDIVLDPFAGGGSTIDVCLNRMRRYWVSDRKPIVERENDIRLLDIAESLPPLHKRWSEVTLTYLDPPYWKQAEGQYSDDAADLANMPLEQFTQSLISVVNRIAEKQTRGVIALLIQPTQWKSDERAFTDHVMHLVTGVNHNRLTLENRVSCPYSSEQYNAQQVDWAKANKKLLVITRELIIWRVN